MDKEINLPLPSYALGTRFEKLIEFDTWLNAKEYDHISIPFSQEQDKGNFVKMWARRPSIRLNLPKLGATVSSRKLFAGKHAPTLEHEDEKVQDAIAWAVHASKMNWAFLDATKSGQAGSCAITISLVEPRTGEKSELIPVLSVWKGCDCTPRLDDADQLMQLDVHYTVKGYEWLGLRNDVTTDCNDKPIDAGEDYWFVRRWDAKEIITLKPLPVGDWNPVQCQWDLVMQSKEIVVPLLTVQNDTGVLPALWIRNSPNGCATDGVATFDGALSNCVHLDYTLSQLGRGINYMGSPQLMVKGRILNYDRGQGGTHVFGPAHMLNLPADRSDPGGASQSNADAKLIEMSGSGIQVGMEQWVEKIKHWTLEMVSLSRKDPNTLNGDMSGRAMEMLDEDFIDLVQVLRETYGDNAYQDTFKLLLHLLRLKGHPKVKGLSEQQINEIRLEWPRMYAPNPQEILYLVQAISGAIAVGLMDNVQGAEWLSAQIDTKFDAVEVEDPEAAQGDQQKPSPDKSSKVTVNVDLGKQGPQGSSGAAQSVDSKPAKTKRGN